MTVPTIGTRRAVEVLHDRGPAAPTGGPRWTSGSGYLIGSGLVLTAAHNVDYRRDLGDDEQLLVRMIDGNELAARVVLAGDEPSPADLALLELGDPRFGEHLPPVAFALVDRDSPEPVTGCWAVGFPRFGEARPVLSEGSSRETWHVRGDILPGAKLRAGLLSLQVTTNPSASLTGSAWEGMSGAVVFAADAHDGEQAAVGVISTHHRPEGESALTVVPITAVADLTAAAEWWQQFGVPDPGALPILPRQRARAGLVRAGWPLAEVRDPFALEVHRPVQPDNPEPDLPELPAYVPRDHDRALGSVVRAAAEGRSGIAVLVGGSSTGKTRACWEALGLLREQEPGWRLWHPIDPSRPDAVLRELPGIGPWTVVWLNEAQFYLDGPADGLGERVAAGLRELLRDPARAPVLVLATMWPEFWDTLTARPVGGADPHAQARELLVGHDITVPAAFTAAQLDQLSEAGDERLALAAIAARDGQIIQFLAGAPELLARYRNAPPAAKALIHAAMDARRLGIGIGLSQAFLAAAVPGTVAAPGYLTDTEWDALGEDWLEQALAYTAQPCKGVRGPLTRIHPRPARSRAVGPGSPTRAEQLAEGPIRTPGGPPYRLADYLDQYGRTHRESQIPPAGFWTAVADHAPVDDPRSAAQAGGDGGDPRPLAGLLDSMREAGAHEQAAALAERAAAQVSLDDTAEVAWWLDAPPPGCLPNIAPEQVAALLRRDPATHVSLDNPATVAWLLDSLREAGASEQVAALLARDPAAQVSLDDPDGVARLLDSLREAGAPEQVAALLARDPAAQVSLDDPRGVARLLDSLREAGAPEQVAALLARDPAAQVSLDEPFFVAALLDGLREAGAHEQVTVLAGRATAHAPVDDLRRVAGLLDSMRRAGAHKQVTILAGRAAAQVPVANPAEVAEVLDSLRETGAPELVAALLARDPAAQVSLDDPRGVARLLGSLREADAPEPVAALLARDPAAQVSLDEPLFVAQLLARLREAGAHEQATALAGRGAAQGPVDSSLSVIILLHELREAGAHKQATVLAGRAAAHLPLDSPANVARLLDYLRRTGAKKQVTALLRRDPAAHVHLNYPDGVARLLGSLREAGAHEQAAALAGRLPGKTCSTSP
jgi:uncharacterized protein YidB (DUF937 family)